MKKQIGRILGAAAFAFAASFSASAHASPISCSALFFRNPMAHGVSVSLIEGDRARPTRYNLGKDDGSYAAVDFLEHGIVHVATSAVKTDHLPASPIFHTPIIAPEVKSAPKNFPLVKQDRQGRVASRELSIALEQNDLGLEVLDSTGQKMLRILPQNPKEAWKSLEIETDATHVYGLGEFPRGVHTDEPWLGWEARTSGEHGNIMSPFYGGVQTYTQFPIALGTRADGTAFGVLVDTPYKIDWDFRTPGRWKASTWGDELRYYVFTGKNLREVHQKYLSLIGKSPVPPRSVLGSGISKFGYQNWADVDHDLNEMKSHGLPVGMVSLDLYWFGGDFIHDPQGGPHYTKMGSLTPDQERFPHFSEKVAQLKKQGTELMLISESYVNANLPEAQQLLEWGCVVKDENGKPIVFENKWWGTGYMIDWTHPNSKKWVQLKYVPLARMGVRNFWFDLGEPEAGLYAPNGRYYGIEPGKNNHGDIHNVYNLMWVKRFKQVMDAVMPNERFYMMNRSGTSGLNRFGAGKWGGDTGMSVMNTQQGAMKPGDMPELIAHLQNRIKNMPLVGVDYYTSDVGGFHRWALQGNKETRDLGYTVWYANSALLDMPFRPHLWVKDGEKNYLPTDTGHVPSNVANTLQRAELEPYYYQAAHRASLDGTPIVAPLFYYHSSDPTVSEMGHEAYIGQDLLMGIVGNVYETQRNIYLPSGGWYDYHTNQYHAGNSGRWLNDVALKRDGTLELPLFAREGAIIPLNRINADGSRVEGEVEFRARVFAGAQASETTIIEDDGATRGYQTGAVRKTRVRQEKTQRGYQVTIAAAVGAYKGAANTRAQRIEFVAPAGNVKRVFRNGVEVKAVATADALSGAQPLVYFDRARNVTVVLAPSATNQTAVYSFEF